MRPGNRIETPSNDILNVLRKSDVRYGDAFGGVVVGRIELSASDKVFSSPGLLLVQGLIVDPLTHSLVHVPAMRALEVVRTVEGSVGTLSKENIIGNTPIEVQYGGLSFELAPLTWAAFMEAKRVFRDQPIGSEVGQMETFFLEENLSPEVYAQTLRLMSAFERDLLD